MRAASFVEDRVGHSPWSAHRPSPRIDRMQSARCWLNAAGSSKFMVWPVFGTPTLNPTPRLP
jgi:hypothetical protein